MTKKRREFSVVNKTRNIASQNRRRGVFLLPNAITTGAMFSGFFAIVAATEGKFLFAGIALLAAMILDALDGRVARAMKAESDFGKQFDSLSDMVAFGVAPGVLAFEWGLNTLSQIGWAITFLYMACAALRLARFNIAGDSSSFTGLPSPMACGVVASAAWLWGDMFQTTPHISVVIVMAALVVGIALLMVSNIRYYSPKLFRIRGRIPYVSFVVLVLVLTVIFVNPPLVFFICTMAYALSGPGEYVWRRFKKPAPVEEVEEIDEEQKVE
ncbi:MAG: CDP-diacylglycerol--serine O-phosphatidyltransferase [Gammaproteobacteria bacterium]|nr:CDP-diacylglycerol--serine O-phosphatidyltransferase [Gammaproteobacteria bacterium]